MPEKHSVAVLYAEDVRGTPGSVRPSDQRVQHVIDTGENSVRQFWVDNVPWFDISMTWFLPCLSINPDRTPLRDGRVPRNRLIDAAIAAATDYRGFDPSLFNHVFVVVHGGTGIEYGSVGKGTNAVVLTSNDFSTVCHELGHCFGFDHSRGFSSGGNIWNDDYGSHYDVMAFPNDFLLADADKFPSGAGLAGPMISRAVVYYDKPQALIETGKVREIDLRGQPATEQVWAAGRSGPPGQPELLVFHTDGVRDDPYHRLMVEYRQPDPSGKGPSRWDKGLDGSMGGDAPGVVVYRIKRARKLDGSDAGFDRPYYAGTVSLAAADYDVEVAYPWGDYVVALREQPEVTDMTPDHVQISVGRAPLGQPSVRIDADIRENRMHRGTVWQLPPDLPAFLGPQEYLVTATFTTWTVAARTYGVGGLSNLLQAEDSTLEWTVDETVVPADGGQHLVHGGQIEARVDLGTRHLTLHNPNPLPDIEVVAVHVQAWDAGAGAHLTADRTLTFEGLTLEPGEALHRLRHWWNLKFQRRYPKKRLTPRDIWQMRFAWRELERVAPQLAARVQPLMEAEEVAWRQELIEHVLRRGGQPPPHL